MDDYDINPEMLFRRPHRVDTGNCLREAQSGNQCKDEPVSNKPENRLSFDFCELSADQLLESTPVSYRNDRANG